MLSGLTVPDFLSDFNFMNCKKNGSLKIDPEVSMDRVSVWGDENVLETGSGDGCTTV